MMESSSDVGRRTVLGRGGEGGEGGEGSTLSGSSSSSSSSLRLGMTGGAHASSGC